MFNTQNKNIFKLQYVATYKAIFLKKIGKDLEEENLKSKEEQKEALKFIRKLLYTNVDIGNQNICYSIEIFDFVKNILSQDDIKNKEIYNNLKVKDYADQAYSIYRFFIEPEFLTKKDHESILRFLAKQTESDIDLLDLNNVFTSLLNSEQLEAETKVKLFKIYVKKCENENQSIDFLTLCDDIKKSSNVNYLDCLYKVIIVFLEQYNKVLQIDKEQHYTQDYDNFINNLIKLNQKLKNKTDIKDANQQLGVFIHFLLNTKLFNQSKDRHYLTQVGCGLFFILLMSVSFSQLPAIATMIAVSQLLLTLIKAAYILATTGTALGSSCFGFYQINKNNKTYSEIQPHLKNAQNILGIEAKHLLKVNPMEKKLQ